ncbi:universal stress protein [Granulicella sp. L60]|uniref:universal stress protein n=1 Tax=Granulicella sp. L60 TaxID=1641866 RepID=UPI00131C1961|nr:universal stress protein [Granulicella sp. L60]
MKSVENLQRQPQISFGDILLATDFSVASEAAYQAALNMCLSFNAKLFILHVFEYANAVPPENGGLLIGLNSFYLEAQSSLDELLRRTKLQGIDCKAKIGSGIPADTILDTITSRNIDLAVLGTNALHGFDRLVFGSTAEAVLRRASCPVLTIGPEVPQEAPRGTRSGPVVFATDFHIWTTCAIRYADFCSRGMKAPLHCLHVLPRALEGKSQSEAIPQIMTEALQQVALENRTLVDPPVCAISYGSQISTAIIEYAKQQNAKLIVLGVRQASMLASHIPAHIAFRVITDAPCPVLTVCYASPYEETFHNADISTKALGDTRDGVLNDLDGIQ